MFKSQPNQHTTIEADVPPNAPSAPEPSFPTSLPPRPQPATGGSTLKSRNCPGFRGLWVFSWNSYSLNTSDKAVLARRICMIAILGLRTALSILAIVYNTLTLHLASVIIGVIFGILGFLFVGWCLAKIGEAQGVRIVFGTRVGRWHWDVFLLVMALIHAGILIGAFFGINGKELPAVWLVLWLLIFAAAWITTWEPEPQSVV